MLNDILIAINNKIFDAFDSDYEIHNNELKQDFKEPCFFVLNITGSNDHVINNRYRRINTFDIHYFPKSKTAATQEMNNVAEILIEQLEYISVAGNLTRGSNMHYEPEDNVLHFFVDYDVFMIKPLEKVPLMETLTQTQHLKGM